MCVQSCVRLGSSLLPVFPFLCCDVYIVNTLFWIMELGDVEWFTSHTLLELL